VNNKIKPCFVLKTKATLKRIRFSTGAFVLLLFSCSLEY